MFLSQMRAPLRSQRKAETLNLKKVPSRPRTGSVILTTLEAKVGGLATWATSQIQGQLGKLIRKKVGVGVLAGEHLPSMCEAPG